MRHLIATACLSLSCSAIAETWTVDDDGPADFDSIQAAIDAASDGDEIVVEPGTYTGTGDEVVNMLGKAITLRSSDGADVTIINGEDERQGIRCGSGETNKTHIDGFTITHGYGNQGGGMSNGGQSVGGSSPKISNCNFTNNRADTSGGGMYNEWTSHPLIVNCLFKLNTAGYAGAGICNRNGSSPTLIACTISGNSSTSENGVGTWGGGMHSTEASSPQIIDCLISDNIATNGGGLCVKGWNSEPKILRCAISNNTAVFGGGIHWSEGSTPSMEDCNISDNTGEWGGGGFVAGGCFGGLITDSSFVRNKAVGGGGGGRGGGGIIQDTFNLTMINCVVADNSAEGSGGGGGLDCRWENLNITLVNCVITNNSATMQGFQGGGVHSDSEVTFIRSSVCSNTPDQIGGEWTDGGGNTIADACPTDCPDINGDGEVGVDEILSVIAAWGTNNTDADVNADGIVDTNDLLFVLSAWGPCP